MDPKEEALAAELAGPAAVELAATAERGGCLAVLTLCGSFSPVTFAHVACFEAARQLLLEGRVEHFDGVVHTFAHEHARTSSRASTCTPVYVFHVLGGVPQVQ